MNPKTVKASILKQQRENRGKARRLSKLFKESPDFRAEAIALAEEMMKKEKEKE